MAWDYDAVVIGDSIAFAGIISSRLAAVNGWSVLTRGVPSESTEDVLDRFQLDAVDVNAQRIFVCCGVNDSHVDPPLPLEDTVTNYAAMKSLADAASPPREIYFNEITPRAAIAAAPLSAVIGNGVFTVAQIQEQQKLRNGRIRKYCIDNGLTLGPSYQEMCETSLTEITDPDLNSCDNIESAYHPADQAVHFNTTGYNRIGDLYNIAEVALPQYTWGAVNEGTNDESWSWFNLAGGASISGDPEIGTLVLPTDATGDSTVKCLDPLSHTITISGTVTSGTVDYYYRTSANNFQRDDSVISWTLYTGAFTATDPFIQFRAQGTSVADANISDVTLSWDTISANLIAPLFMTNTMGHSLFKTNTM